MNSKFNPQLLEFAKSMRHTATDAEQLMWQMLRAKRFMNLKFRRQYVVAPYIVDFYCHEIGLVVELDSSQHGTDERQEYDAERTKFLEGLWRVCFDLESNSLTFILQYILNSNHQGVDFFIKLIFSVGVLIVLFK